MIKGGIKMCLDDTTPVLSSTKLQLMVAQLISVCFSLNEISAEDRNLLAMFNKEKKFRDIYLFIQLKDNSSENLRRMGELIIKSLHAK